jgi:hypothetical protein
MTNGSVTSVPLPGSEDVQLSMFVPGEDALLEFMSKADSATGEPVASYCELVCLFFSLYFMLEPIYVTCLYVCM